MATIVNSNDFVNSALADNQVTVTRIPVTKTFTGNGDEIRTDGTSESINVIFHRNLNNFDQKEEGLHQSSDGYIMTAPTQTINRDDKIVYCSETFRIKSVITRGPSGDTAIYKYATIELIS